MKGLKEIAGGRHITLSDLVATIDTERQQGNLSSAIRLFVLDFYRKQLSDLKVEHSGTHQVMGRSVPAYSCLHAEAATPLRNFHAPPRGGACFDFPSVV